MKQICFKTDDEKHEIVTNKARKAGMTLKDYLMACAIAANVEVNVNITFDQVKNL